MRWMPDCGAVVGLRDAERDPAQHVLALDDSEPVPHAACRMHRLAQTGDMRVQLKLVLDASPDAVWAALRSPSVLAEVAHPFFSFEPLSPRGLPQRLDARVRIRSRARVLWGSIPVGEQVIDIRFRERGDVRIVEDDGGPVSGPLAVVTGWRHRMAVAAAPGRPHPVPRSPRHLGRAC